MHGGVLVAVLCVLAACGDNATIEPAADAAPLPPTPKLDVPATVTIIEGERRTFVVKLVEDPLEDVTIGVTSRDPATAIVETASITLTSATYATGVEVAVRGVEDDDDVINEPVELVFTIGDVVKTRIAARVMDNDVQQVVFDTTSLTIVEGASATFDVRLARLPEAPVTVLLDTSAPAVATAAPTMLTFAPAAYATPQTVTVTALADADTASHTVSIAARGASIAEPQAVAIAVTDDDVQGLVISAPQVAVTEGGTASFTVALAFDPGAPTALDVQSSDPGALQITSTHLFDSTNYSVPQTVTLAGVEDSDRLHETATVALGGIASGSVTVPITDNDDIIVSATEVQVSEGRTGGFTVRLANDPGPSGRAVSVELLIGNLTLLTSSLTFTSADYAIAQPVQVYAPVDTSSLDRGALVRVTYADQAPQDVALTIRHRATAGTIGVSLWHEHMNAGVVGWVDADFGIDTTWPGDGRLVITFPSDYDASAATVLSTDIDGALTVTATTSTITIARSGGTTVFGPAAKALRLGGVRNPGAEGHYAVTVATQTASGDPLDRGTTSDWIWAGWMASGDVTFANVAPGGTGNVTVTFTTSNPWPADAIVDVTFPAEFDVSAATIASQTGVDGTLTASMTAPQKVRVVRAGGTALPRGGTTSFVLANVTNPPTSRATTDFSIVTSTASGAAIDVGGADGVTIGCPATMTKRAHGARNVPFGGDAWGCPGCVTNDSGGAYIGRLEASDFLVVDDFRFSMPTGAAVAGIRFDLRRNTRNWPAVDSAVRAVKTTIGTADRAGTTQWQSGERVSYGGATDLWGAAWSAADVESPTFGVALAARAVTPGMTAEVWLYDATATVYLDCPP